MTLQQAMVQLNTEFSDRISEIENSVAHDEMQQNGQRAVWKEILTIYAVQTTTGTENPMDAATIGRGPLCGASGDILGYEYYRVHHGNLHGGSACGN